MSAASATVAGAVAGYLLALAGGLLPQGARAVGVLVGCSAIGIGATCWRNPWPQLDRETEQSLLHRGPIAWAVLNGAQLGLGFTSRIGFWTWYLIPVGAFLLADPVTGAVAWGLYGLLRLAAAIAIAYAAATPEQLLARITAALRRRGRATTATRYLAVCLAAILVLAAGV